MFAIAVLFFIFFYFLISSALAWGAVYMARKNGVRGWVWGLPVFIFMIGLIFWDWLPMEISFKHKCDSYGGLTILKTLEQWKKENPGVAKTLNSEPGKSLPAAYLIKTEGSKRYYLLPNGTELTANYDNGGKYMFTDMMLSDGTRAYWLNQRFFSVRKNTRYWFYIEKNEEQIIDMKTNRILAKVIEFRTNILPIGIGSNRLSDYKFWMKKSSCIRDDGNNKWLGDDDSFYSLKMEIKNLAGDK